MQVAETKGLPKLKYHLLPRTKGFWVTVQNLRGTGENLSRSLHITSCMSAYSHFQRSAHLNPLCLFFCTVAAVYDSTLNFRNNEMPTLLGILSGKKYHADLYVRYTDCFLRPHGAFSWTWSSCLYLRAAVSLVACRRIPLDVIPEDEPECADWLHKLYQEKVRRFLSLG